MDIAHINFPCPHCGQSLRIREDYRGTSGKCKYCEQSFTVPKTGEPDPTLTAPDSKLQGNISNDNSFLNNVFILCIWFLYGTSICLIVLSPRVSNIEPWFAGIPFILSLSMLIGDLQHRKVSGIIMASWILFSLFAYPLATPLYLFRRGKVRQVLAIPASLLLTGFSGMMAFEQAQMLFPESIFISPKDQRTDNVTSSTLPKTAVDTSEKSAANNSDSKLGIAKTFGIDPSSLEYFQVKGLYLGMSKTDAISALRKEISDIRIFADREDIVIATLNGSGEQGAYLKFAAGELISYEFKAEMVDRLFKTGTLNESEFAQEFINSYEIEEMKIETDSSGNETLVYRDEAGFIVSISGEKTLSVELLKNAGKPSFN